MARPKISCLMPVFAGCERLAPFALKDFLAQACARIELVVAVETREQELALVGAHGDDLRISSIVTGKLATRAALRQATLNRASGELICLWEPDQRHHPDRLANQLRAMYTGPAACCFADQFFWFYDAGRLAWVDYRTGDATCSHFVATTLMAWRASVGFAAELVVPGAELDDLRHKLGDISPLTEVRGMTVRTCHNGSDLGLDKLRAEVRRSGMGTTGLQTRQDAIVARLEEYAGPARPLKLMAGDGTELFTARLGA